MSREGRYVQARLLGQGAMGAVYPVRDRETGEQLARKKLFRTDDKSALRIKREFRSLADMSPPTWSRSASPAARATAGS